VSLDRGPAARPGKPTTGPVEVTVLIEEGNLDAIDDVATSLAQVGLQVTQTLESAGVITGYVNDSSLIEALRGIDGVASVEIAHTFQLPPPDEPVQ
jgi:hypothetical protein